MHNTARAHLETDNTTGVWRPRATPKGLATVKQDIIGFRRSRGKDKAKADIGQHLYICPLSNPFTKAFSPFSWISPALLTFKVSLSMLPSNLQSLSWVTASKPRLGIPKCDLNHLQYLTHLLSSHYHSSNSPSSASTVYSATCLGFGRSTSSRVRTYSRSRLQILPEWALNLLTEICMAEWLPSFISPQATIAFPLQTFNNLDQAGAPLVYLGYWPG